jgi:hypothetical protein
MLLLSCLKRSSTLGSSFSLTDVYYFFTGSSFDLLEAKSDLGLEELETDGCYDVMIADLYCGKAFCSPGASFCSDTLSTIWEVCVCGIGVTPLGKFDFSKEDCYLLLTRSPFRPSYTTFAFEFPDLATFFVSSTCF